MKASIIEISMAVFGGIDLLCHQKWPLCRRQFRWQNVIFPLVDSPHLFSAFQAFYKIFPPSLLSDPIEMFHPFCCNMYTSSPLLDRVCLCKRARSTRHEFHNNVLKAKIRLITCKRYHILSLFCPIIYCILPITRLIIRWRWAILIFNEH